MRARLSVLAAALVVAAALPVPARAETEDPCSGPQAHTLLCPNLRIGPPADLYLQDAGGRELLRTTSDVRSRATLRFADVGSYFGGSYWKVHELARFELRRASPGGELGRVVRVGPKLNYCLRDLERTRPGRHSPDDPHYPGCNQNPYQDRVTLGTSVGWSDIYPADYDKQWIDVTGLRGCFAFTMTVDPQHLLFESNERDNTSQHLVRLPFTGNDGC